MADSLIDTNTYTVCEKRFILLLTVTNMAIVRKSEAPIHTHNVAVIKRHTNNKMCTDTI